jgi:tRNA threonylcarbamoyladenosine biosynthesis protein TsaE
MQQRRENETVLAITVRDETETARVAQAVARVAVCGDVIALHGDLGSGKTAFARGFIRTLTAADEDVPSPTFTLVQTYAADRADLYHFDFYRIEDPEEAWEIGIEDAFDGGISLIEWPENIGGLLPADRLDVILQSPPGGPETARRITLAGGRGWRRRLADLTVAFGEERDA